MNSHASDAARITGFLLYALVIGALIGAFVWFYLVLMNFLIGWLWTTIPEALHFPFYPIVMCLIGGLIIGYEQKRFGSYPQEMNEVLAEFKETGNYGKGKIPLLFISALLPLIFAAPLGPEAGLTGLIVCLCVRAGQLFGRRKNELKELGEISLSAGLAVLFNAPLFGFSDFIRPESDELLKTRHPYANVMAVIGAFLALFLLQSVTGLSSGGLPRLVNDGIVTWSMTIPYLLCALTGALAGVFFLLAERISNHLVRPFDSFPIAKALLAGLLIGLFYLVDPIILFSGESQLELLPEVYTSYSAVGLILVAFVKLFLITYCMRCGWRGGHFFPAIFAGAAIGYGFSLLFPDVNPILCVAAGSAALMGAIMKAPVAVSLLLILCYPPGMLLFMIGAALIGTLLSVLFSTYILKEKPSLPAQKLTQRKM